MTGTRGEIEVSIALQRGFLGVEEEEIQEVVALVRGRPLVGYARTSADQVALLRRAQTTRWFEGAYLLANPFDPRIGDRYDPGYWGPAYAGRTGDRDILARRVVYVDIDPVRPRGISATEAEHQAARDIAWRVREWLASVLGGGCIGFGCSGNGYYLTIAIVPEPVDPNQVIRLRRFLERLHRRFGTEGIAVDTSVTNPGRLMPAGGTWKRKGADTPERPHRLTSFSCRANVERVPLTEVY